ncbi:rCG33425, isoform CRA_a, partial [Rattus norvegicus]
MRLGVRYLPPVPEWHSSLGCTHERMTQCACIRTSESVTPWSLPGAVLQMPLINVFISS